MLGLKLCDIDVKPAVETNEPYPNSILHVLDDSFLESLILEDPVEENAKPVKGFWGRQTAPVVTRKQGVFDWLFGVVMPAVCFYFDPIVFRDWGNTGDALLGRFQLPVYVVSGLAIMATATWLLWWPKLRAFGLLFSGSFAISGVIALLIGIVLFPFSVIGLLVLLGFLGFTPLFTSYVLFRNAVRAYRAAIQ